VARIPEGELERLKAGVSLVRLVEASGVKLERRGKDHVGRCPFHEDGTPSLSVSAEKNLWRCFGCEAGGDVIAWVMRREGVSFRHAVELLKADYAPDASAPAPAVKSTVAKLPALATPAEDAALMGEVMGYYHTALKRTSEALAYLEGRGLMHPELVDHFQLGFSDRTLGYRLPQANRKAGADVRGRLMALGVLRESGHEHLRGSLVVPLFDAEGRVVNLYGRKIRDDLRKGTPDHLYLPGPHRGMLNRAALAASEEIILCEALIDAMTFWCAGYRHVTSAYGAGGMTEEIEDALEAHGVKRVLIAFDRDAAGEKGAADVAARLAKRGLGVYRVNFPKGMDANAYALSVKPADKALGALLRNAEWLAGGSRRRPVLDADGLDADGLDGSEKEGAAEEEDAQPGAIMAPDPVPSAPSSSASLPPTGLPPPISASPIPPGPRAETMAETEIGERDVVIRLGDRVWRARGLSRNPGVESLKVNLMVRRPTGDGAEAFHVDGLDLLSAKARGAFATEAALELALPLEAVKRDLGLVLLKLEAVQDERLEAAKAAEKAAPAMSAAEESAALAWLKAPGLLQRIAADIATVGVVGEEANAQAAYLAALSRKLDRPLAVLIQSTSAAGKSALMDAVLDLVPEEERVAYSAMTGQSLFYIGEADLKHKALAIAEEEGARHASYALKLLQSQGTLTIASTGKDPATGKLITQEYRVEGPVALMMTTTAIDLDEELKNRCLVLTIDEGRDQTRAIHARQRFEETLGGLAAKEDRSAILALHRNAQRLIKPLKVVNPYAERLTFMDDKTRTRRDHRKYLALIRTIALLHQHQRPIRTLHRPDDRAGAGPAGTGPAGTGPVCAEPVCYVEATLDDIAAAGALAHAVLGTTLDELPPQTRRLLRLVHELVAARASAEGVKPREVRFTRRELRERVLWGDTQLKVHLKRLEELEYVLARRDGGRSVYELAWAGEGVDGTAFVMGLIDVEALRAEQSGAEQRANKESYDDDRAGQSAAPAGVSRPLVGPRSGGGRDGEHRETSMPLRALRGEDASDTENARRGSVEQATPYANGLLYLHGGLRPLHGAPQGGLHGGE
jgi:DNA primase catalytic core